MLDPKRVSVFSIPSHYSFSDALAAGLIARFGADPLGLANGRILLPNNRAVRALNDAFVRASGKGLLLPRLIPIGDPELEERVGAALDGCKEPDDLARAVDPGERLLQLASLLRPSGTAESVRLAADLARTLDSLTIEEIDPARLKDAVTETGDLAHHWEHSLARLQLIYEAWPQLLAARASIDLATRRNLQLRRLADEWAERPPPGFTVAAGITTAAPAVAALVASVVRMPMGMAVLPGLWLAGVMPDDEWDALGPSENGRGETTHPQFHLKLLLGRIGVARAEVETWSATGGITSPAVRTRAVANAFACSEFSHKWESLPRAERQLSGIRIAELDDSASEAQAIALALRGSLENQGKTAALVTPDRQLARRVSALLARWGIEADDSAGKPLATVPCGTLLLNIAAAAAEQLAPVALLALLKHPLVGGEGPDRVTWLASVRQLDRKLRGPRPAPGIGGLDAHFADLPAWKAIRSKVEIVARVLAEPRSLAHFADDLASAVRGLCGEGAWRGPAGRLAAEIISELQSSPCARDLVVGADEAVPLLRLLLDRHAVRPPYGGHPRIFIWGLLEARLQRADLVILGGLNEGTWPALPGADPWLPPAVRATLRMQTSESRIGLTAHDFVSALGAPEVLITRARRDSKSPTIASRFLLRLNAVCGRLPRHVMLERVARVLDDPGVVQPVDRPSPSPPIEQRPRRISVTQVDRLKADPFAFYAQKVLNLRAMEAVDADHTAAWKGTAVHKIFEDWLAQDDCDPDTLRGRAERLLAGESIHPMLRALWGPRLFEAIDWIADVERANRVAGRRPLAAEVDGETTLAGVAVHGRADRIDLLRNGGLAIIDYKTGAPPTKKAVDAGFALQLGLLGNIAAAGGFKAITGEPCAFEYWSLARHNGTFGRLMCPATNAYALQFVEQAKSSFIQVAAKWLNGTEPFTAKLNPAYAPYGDYDQLMRLEEWYGR